MLKTYLISNTLVYVDYCEANDKNEFERKKSDSRQSDASPEFMNIFHDFVD